MTAADDRLESALSVPELAAHVQHVRTFEVRRDHPVFYLHRGDRALKREMLDVVSAGTGT